MLSSTPLPVLSFTVVTPSVAPRRTGFRPPLVIRATATTYKEEQSSSTNFRSRTPHGMASCNSLYEILRVPAGATNQEIKSAYRRLARTVHPDVAALDRKDTSADEFIRIHAAYTTLSDPEKRAVYDSNLFRRKQTPQPLTTAVRFSGYGGGRNWETDQCW